MVEGNLHSFTSDDGLSLKYLDTAHLSSSTEEDLRKPTLIVIHGFTGTHHVWKRNIPALSQHYRIVAPDLRGHGESQMPEPDQDGEFKVERSGVVRLASDLRGLIEVLAENEGVAVEEWRGAVLGGSLGCAIIWAYANLYGTNNFTHAILIDQSPLQNQITGNWDPPYCHKGLRNGADFNAFSQTILNTPEKAHVGTIHSCLGYLSHPPSISSHSAQDEKESYESDKDFFLGEAMKGDSRFYIALMRDHTALDHRGNITKAFGPGSGSRTKLLVVASSRSGCFEPEGVLSVVGFVNGGGDDIVTKGLAIGETVSWGGHWCYWEDPEKFQELVLNFLSE